MVVVAGRPGTGKTTLARPLCARLGAGYLRVDAIETAIARINGLVSGPEGYAVADEIARSNLIIGRSVVVDAVCPVPEARAGWTDLAIETRSRLVMFETYLADQAEHKRRVINRLSDIEGHQVPDWHRVQALDYVSWNEERDGPRVRINTADAPEALKKALAVVGLLTE